MKHSSPYDFARLPTIGLGLVLLAPASDGIAQERALDVFRTEALEAVHFPTSCEELVQTEFERGVAFLHSFESQEALRSFRKVAQDDPGCGMAWWGIAAAHATIAWGPAWVDVESGLAAIRRAITIGGLSDRERAYVDALAPLFEGADSVAYPERLRRHVSAMEELQARFGEDREAALFYAVALIATLDPSDTTYATQRLAGAVAERVFRELPNHPGAAHLVIHAYDYPPFAERALEAARRYAEIAPQAMHARHMPSHIFSRLGLWEESIRSNLAVLAAASPEHADVGHALDYLVYAYLQRGDDEKAARRHQELLDYGAANAGTYVADEHLADIMARYVLERRAFAEAARVAVPSTFEREPRFVATVIFARAWGAARSGDAERAATAASRLPVLAQALSAAGYDYYAANVRIWHRVVEGWIAKAQGDDEKALQLLRDAAVLDDATAYVGNLESSADALVHTWEELGDLLLELHRPAEAMEAYERSLATSPNRFNALYGAARAARLAGANGRAALRYQDLLDLAAGSSRSSLEEARSFLSPKGRLEGQLDFR